MRCAWRVCRNLDDHTGLAWNGFEVCRPRGALAGAGKPREPGQVLVAQPEERKASGSRPSGPKGLGGPRGEKAPVGRRKPVPFGGRSSPPPTPFALQADGWLMSFWKR